jgi:hypothetical protein
MLSHVAIGLRFWAEAQALDIYHRKHGILPAMNQNRPFAGVGVIKRDDGAIDKADAMTVPVSSWSLPETPTAGFRGRR